MARPSSEALLISALINCSDTALGALHGVEAEMFIGYGAEYRWVLSYEQTYGSAPSWDALLSRFPEFPRTEHTDAAFAADEVRYSHQARTLKTTIRTAAVHTSEGDYESAAMVLASWAPLSRARVPVNALHDLSFLERYDERPDFITCPWRSLQTYTGGIREGDLWYLAARLSNGKSWLAVEMTAQALLDGRDVAYYSLEMPRQQVLTRIHVALGHRLGIDVDHVAMRDRVYDAIAYRKLVHRIRDEVTGSLYVFDPGDGRVSPATVAAHADRAELHVIDYAGLMASPLGKKAIDDWRVMAAISNELKETALARKTRILCLSQINRDGDSVSRRPPKVKHLSQSDALGQDGDVVVTHKLYSRSSQVLSLEKNRHGVCDRQWYTRFLPNEGAFGEISRELADELRATETEDE